MERENERLVEATFEDVNDVRFLEIFQFLTQLGLPESQKTPLFEDFQEMTNAQPREHYIDHFSLYRLIEKHLDFIKDKTVRLHKQFTLDVDRSDQYPEADSSLVGRLLDRHFTDRLIDQVTEVKCYLEEASKLLENEQGYKHLNSLTSAPVNGGQLSGRVYFDNTSVNRTDDYTLSVDPTEIAVENRYQDDQSHRKKKPNKKKMFLSRLDKLQNELNTIKDFVGINSVEQTSNNGTSVNESASGYGEEEIVEYGSVQNGGTDSQMGGGNQFENDDIEDNDNEHQQEPNLTMSVWPPHKLFLIVIRKMFTKGLINEDERHRLKVMILDSEKELEEILDRYERDGNEKVMFTQIKSLLENKK